MDKVQEIMELVEQFAALNHAWEHSECKISELESSRDSIESALRALLDRKPLDAHQRMEVLHAIPDDDDAEEEWMLTDKQIQLIIDGVERAHGIGA